jgi:hypothetical protein
MISETKKLFWSTLYEHDDMTVCWFNPFQSGKLILSSVKSYLISAWYKDGQ